MTRSPMHVVVDGSMIMTPFSMVSGEIWFACVLAVMTYAIATRAAMRAAMDVAVRVNRKILVSVADISVNERRRIFRV